MTEPMSAEHPGQIEAHIAGQISGQVAVGSYNVQIGSIHGGVVTVAVPGQQPVPRKIPPPIRLCPISLTETFDREAEVAGALAAVGNGSHVEFHGPPGVGKTVLLIRLSGDPSLTTGRDRIAYISGRREPVADLLQSLFDAFYETDGPFKPTEAQLRRYLADVEALVLLDDVDLDRDDLQRLLFEAPRCRFLFATATRGLWGEGRSFALHGLPEDAALQLVERELGRALVPAERDAALRICRALEGHPLRILQAAAQVREEGRAMDEVATLVEGTAPQTALTSEMVAALEDPQRAVLGLLAALRGAPIHRDEVARVTGIADAGAILNSLKRLGLARSHSPRYSTTTDLPPPVLEELDASSWGEKALRHFSQRGEAYRTSPRLLDSERQAVMTLLEWAARGGRWRDVLQLVAAIDPALALGGRWGAWRSALEAAAGAAQVLGDPAAEGWALHQLGTRALVLDEPEAADHLREALRLRESIGDRAGAAVTRHNLQFLIPPPPPPSQPPPPPDRPGGVSVVRNPAPPPVAPPHGPMETERRQEPPVPPPAPSPGRRLAPPPVVLAGSLVLLVLIGFGAWRLLRRGPLPPPLPAVAKVTAAPTSVDFKDWLVGTRSRMRDVTIRNDAPSPLRITRTSIEGEDAGQFVADGAACERAAVAPGRSCTVRVGFVPTAAGSRSGSLSLEADAGRDPLTVAMIGTGILPDVEIDRARLDFGEQAVDTRSGIQAVTIRNAGAAPLSVQVLPVRGEGDEAVGEFPVVSTSCLGAPLGAGQSCMVAVAFKPATAGGRSASLPIGHGPDEPISIALAGIGTGGTATLAASPPTVDFDNVAAGTRSPVRAVTLSNASGASIQIRSFRLGGADTSAFTVTPTTCRPGASLLRDGRCTLGVVFQPASAGGRSATVVVDHTGGGGPLTIALTGTGAVASAAVEPARLDLGSRAVGSATELSTVSVRNGGAAPLTIGAVALAGADPRDFVFSADRCSRARIDPGRDCTVGVGFAPQREGGRSATLTIPHDAAGSPLTVALSGTGSATADLSVTIAPSPSMDSSERWMVTVRNGGPSDATDVRLVVSPLGLWHEQFPSRSWKCGGTTLGLQSEIVCTLRVLSAGDQVGLELQAGVNGQEATPSLTAVVKGREADPHEGDNKAHMMFPVPSTSPIPVPGSGSDLPDDIALPVRSFRPGHATTV